MAARGGDVESTASEERIRENFERTDVTRNKRRLDSFARLLAAYSECIAVAVLNGKFYITANELDADKKTSSEGYQSIKKIMDYFVKIANGVTVSKQEREQAFKDICLTKRFSLINKKAPGFYITPEVVNKTVKLFFNKTPIHRLTFEQEFNHLDSEKEKQGHSSLRRYARVAGSIYGHCSELYRDFLKIEHALKKGRAPKEKPGHVDEVSDDEGKESAEQESLTNEELAAVQSGNYDISLREPAQQTDKKNKGKKKSVAEDGEDEKESDEVKKSTVHAEVQLLSEIISLIQNKQLPPPENETTIYIGISKLCCHYCRIMIAEANAALKKEGHSFKIEVRGHSDLVFGSRSPQRFALGYLAAEREEFVKDDAKMPDPLSFNIGFNSKKGIFAFDNKDKAVQGKGLPAGGSDSETADSVGINKRQMLQQELANALQVIKKWGNKNPEPLELAIKLHDLKRFEIFYESFEADEIEDHDIRPRVMAILGLLNKKLERDEQINESVLINLLSDVDYVGDEFSKKFGNIIKKGLFAEKAFYSSTAMDDDDQDEPSSSSSSNKASPRKRHAVEASSSAGVAPPGNTFLPSDPMRALPSEESHFHAAEPPPAKKAKQMSDAKHTKPKGSDASP